MTTTPSRVAVIGARGRMGRAVCAAVDAAPDLTMPERGPEITEVR